jgi:hypothetical protein
MPQFKKGDRVRAKATLFDGGEGTRDRNGLLFSEKWAADGHGEWCYGAVSFVYSRRGRHTQLYRVKYDEGTVMQAEDAHLELAEDEDDSDEESDNELGGSEAENSNDETVYEEQVGGFRIGERAVPRGVMWKVMKGATSRKIRRESRVRTILGIC